MSLIKYRREKSFHSERIRQRISFVRTSVDFDNLIYPVLVYKGFRGYFVEFLDTIRRGAERERILDSVRIRCCTGGEKRTRTFRTKMAVFFCLGSDVFPTKRVFTEIAFPAT